MSILYLLVPLAFAMVIAAIIGFRWATRDGQFDDMDSPAVRMLDD